MATTQVASSQTVGAPSWHTWVPCVGMALCSWLAFVDRQVLTILAPTIIRDTGLTDQNFTDASAFFFLAYTLGKLMIRKLRTDWLSANPGATPQQFHDKFLSFGSPPIPLVRQEMLDATGAAL